MTARCAIVPKGEGESARKKLSEAGLLRRDLAISSDTANVYLPVLEGPALAYPEGEREFEAIQLRAKSYKELAEVPAALRGLLPTSFDIVGDVAVFKLQDELLPHATAIGEAILKANKGVKTAALDEGVEGEMRVRRLLVIAGRKTTLTTHKEYGIALRVDPALVYFSPRLANERWRVASLVEDGELVIDMFAGVGPFSILIAKTRKPGKVHAIDINEHAIELLTDNVKRNNVDRMEAHLGDARKLAPGLGPADRVIMNLPHSAHEFLGAARECTKDGSWLHVYQIVQKGGEEPRARELEGMLGGGTCWAWRIVHPYSPGSSVVAYDMKVG